MHSRMMAGPRAYAVRPPSMRRSVTVRAAAKDVSEPNWFVKMVAGNPKEEAAFVPDPEILRAALASDPNPEFKLASSQGEAMTNFKLSFALPWRRFKKGSALVLDLKGEIGDTMATGFGSGGTLSVPGISECLRKAALDPRVVGLVIRVSPLQCGWSKLQQIRRDIEFFKQSGKFSVAYCEIGGEKEYYLASACKELYVAPQASLSLRGLSLSGSFLRGVFDKVGIEPEVKRIGKYKSAGDQLLRSDMSEAQKEQLNALLDDVWAGFLGESARSRGKTKEDLEALLDEGVFDMKRLLELGWVDGLKYEDDLIDLMKERTYPKKKDEYALVGYRRYIKVSPSAFGLNRGKQTIAVMRTVGGIGSVLSEDRGSGGGIAAKSVVNKLRALEKNKAVKAIVLFVNSPGGDALASDVMWNTIRRVSKTKPVVALMGDVAASGGYYMSMACSKILAEPLTITGSIGVVTGKFNLRGVYERVGFAKEVISKGKYAEILNETRSFTDTEKELFDRAAQYAYESFRNKAAECRGMQPEELEPYAQGRVWTGERALSLNLVDGLGGLDKAVRVAKVLANIPESESVRLLETTKTRTSPLAALGLGASAASSSSEWLVQPEPLDVIFSPTSALSWVLSSVLPVILYGAVETVLARTPLGGVLSEMRQAAGLGSGSVVAALDDTIVNAASTGFTDVGAFSSGISLSSDILDVSGSGPRI